jgi:uncharacterized membrane protein YcaP (DUF421 family)
MYSLVRALTIFFFCMLVFRLSGKRTMKDITVFDFVMLLIISESTQQALLDNDFSLINGLLTIAAYVIISVGLSLLKQKSPKAEKLLDGTAVILIENGKLLERNMKKSRIGKDDILESAREQQGLENIDEIKYAILEKDGVINIIPVKK